MHPRFRFHGWPAACLVGALLVGAVPAALAGGRVEVHMVQPERFADAGWGAIEREQNLTEIAHHMERWADRLPDGTVLKLDVLDVDLAGAQWRSVRRPDLRIMDGRIDGPRMTLRWSLLRGDQVLKSGEDRLSDMNYLMNALGPMRQEPLGYDKRMFDRWMRQIVDETPAR